MWSPEHEEDHWGDQATMPPDHQEHEVEEHRGEQATTPPDLEEEGEHQEQSTPMEGNHREEQGSREGAAVAWSPDRRCLVTGHAPWPHRWLKKWRSSLVARLPYHGCCISRASMAPPNIQGKCWALENTSSFQGHCCKPNFGPNPLFLGLRPI
jgi:hypothetical protein